MIVSVRDKINETQILINIIRFIVGLFGFLFFFLVITINHVAVENWNAGNGKSLPFATLAYD